MLKVKSDELCEASLCQPRGQMVVAMNSVDACRAPARVAEKPAVNGEESQRIASDGAGCDEPANITLDSCIRHQIKPAGPVASICCASIDSSCSPPMIFRQGAARSLAGSDQAIPPIPTDRSRSTERSGCALEKASGSARGLAEAGG